MTASEGSLGHKDNLRGAALPHPASEITLRKTEYEGTAYVCPTWDQMGEYNFALGRQIIESGQSFDRLVALARGGWTWGRDLAGHLGIEEISSMRIKGYKGTKKNTEKPKLTQPLTDAVAGERILLFDEVIDSGETIEVARPIILSMGAKDVTVASLCFKPDTSVVTPDYWAFSTDAWVVFPHEMREFIEERALGWTAGGKGLSEVKDRLAQIGVPENQTDFYLALMNLK